MQQSQLYNLNSFRKSELWLTQKRNKKEFQANYFQQKDLEEKCACALSTTLRLASRYWLNDTKKRKKITEKMFSPKKKKSSPRKEKWKCIFTSPKLSFKPLIIYVFVAGEFFIYEYTPSFDFLFSFFAFVFFLSIKPVSGFLRILLHMNKFFIHIPAHPHWASDEENNITHFVLLQYTIPFYFLGKISSSAMSLIKKRLGTGRACFLLAFAFKRILYCTTIYLKSFWLMMKWAMNLKLNVAFSFFDREAWFETFNC